MLINLLKLTIVSSRIWNQSLKPGLNCQVSTWETQIWVKVWWGKRWSLGRHVPWWAWISLESRRQYPLEQSNGRDIYPPLFRHVLIPLWWRCPSPPPWQLPASHLSGLLCGPSAQQLLRKPALWHGVATQSRWGAVRVRERGECLKETEKAGKDYVSFMCN